MRDPHQGGHLTEHIYAHEHPESDRVRGGGFTLWFTGLSGSGKTTIAHLVGPELERRGHIVEYLDGDTVRTHLSKGLGFSKEDRDTHIERVGWVASRLTRHGAAVIAAAISPYEETRRTARALVDRTGERPDGVDSLELVTLTSREVSDLDMIACGALSPLEGFMGRKDYLGVVEEMQLARGLRWALPVCLAVDTAPQGDRIALA